MNFNCSAAIVMATRPVWGPKKAAKKACRLLRTFCTIVLGGNGIVSVLVPTGSLVLRIYGSRTYNSSLNGSTVNFQILKISENKTNEAMF